MEDLFEGVEIEETAKVETANDEKPNKRQERADFFKAKQGLENERDSAKRENSTLKQVLGAMGYKGSADEIRMQYESENSGKSIEEIQEHEENLKTRIREEIKAEYEKKAEQEKATQLQFASDLAEVKAKYPNEKAKSPLEFGEKYIKLMATGEFTSLEAYELSRPKEESPTLNENRAKGTGKNSGIERDYFEQDEVKAMSREEIKKNFEKIENSMKKWR